MLSAVTRKGGGEGSVSRKRMPSRYVLASGEAFARFVSVLRCPSFPQLYNDLYKHLI